jgi:predicted GIY-YIG superfamily endonuclease
MVIIEGVVMFYVYILYGSKSKNFYYGYTYELKKRFQEHKTMVYQKQQNHLSPGI